MTGKLTSGPGAGASPRSSSCRGPGVCDAIVTRHDQHIGPLRLPDHRADDFIFHFNQTYEGLGMKLQAVESPEDDESALP